MESIIQVDKEHCYLCGRNGSEDPLECHHIFGKSDRQHSEEDGLKVWLCGDRCHRNGPESAHRCRKTDLMLKQIAQKTWESQCGTREQFIARYGRNYL